MTVPSAVPPVGVSSDERPLRAADSLQVALTFVGVVFFVAGIAFVVGGTPPGFPTADGDDDRTPTPAAGSTPTPDRSTTADTAATATPAPASTVAPTPVSEPGRMNSASSARRVAEEPRTFVTARFRAPAALATSRASSVSAVSPLWVAFAGTSAVGPTVTFSEWFADRETYAVPPSRCARRSSSTERFVTSSTDPPCSAATAGPPVSPRARHATPTTVVGTRAVRRAVAAARPSRPPTEATSITRGPADAPRLARHATGPHVHPAESPLDRTGADGR